ncbi:glycosyltransferase family 4 protein [Oscillatoria sp. CS-180]|uniref:glycosyltransferase family 4 protein n=1 Tax=Oscillatoria sp. CS-180 TaxID=3021720 RepID=UPI0023308A73|nr:glycosyltransferase family 4 protein [Oscillatoria sp. CS-180]MDB9525410.1 glycosyltransferase family 4 protein [Oscillatoria sp. CS-180]
MKILFVSNVFPPHVRGGYEIGCLELARQYQLNGHSVVVASSEVPPSLRTYPSPTDIDVRYVFLPVKYYDAAYNKQFEQNSVYIYERTMAFGGYLESNCIALQRLLELEDPDLIWIFNPLGLGPVGVLDTCVSSGKKILIHLMDDIDGVVSDYTKVFNFQNKWSLLKQEIVAISCSKKIFLANNKIGKFNRNETIYNWVDFTKSRHEKDTTDFKVESKKSIFKRFRVVYFGQINAKKGVMFIYELSKRIAASSLKSQILIEIYGSGDLAEWLRNELDKDKEVNEVLKFKGFLEKARLFKRLEEADLALFPLSKDEPFGYAPVEAVMKGIPIMLTKEVGCSELFTDEEVIFIQDRSDIDELYEKLVWCLENQKRLASMIFNAQETVRENCDLSTVTIPKLNEIISSLKPTDGYGFEHILSTCELCRYPLPNLEKRYRLWNPRYRLADLIFDSIYNIPFFGFFLEKQEEKLVRYYKAMHRKS